MTARHTLLTRQLRRVGLSDDAPPTAERWKTLLELVSQVYVDADEERYTTERAFSLASREMQDLHDRLQARSRDDLELERDKLSQTVIMLSATMETMTDGLLVVDRARRVRTYNRRFVELWRIPKDVVDRGEDEHLLAAVVGLLRDPDEFMTKVAHLYDHPDETSDDEITLSDGRVFDRHSAPVYDPAGRIHARMWRFRDVTAHRRAEDELRQATRFLDSIIENLPDMVFVKEAEQLRFVRLNRAGEELLGYPRDVFIGRSDHNFFPEAQAATFVAHDRHVLESGTLVDISEETITTRTQGERVLHTKKIPILDEAGRPRFLLGISRDITAQKRTQDELRVAKETAERASQAKTQFLANMSHELRTPLNAIVGFARLLVAAPDASSTEYLNYILHASEHMLSLVNDLLDLRRVEVGRDYLQLGTQRLEPLAAAAARIVAPLLAERHHTFANLCEGAPAARCDARAVVQVLTNLLSNAAKYTEEGGMVELSSGASPEVVWLAVRDNGIGIAPEDQDRLFTYFQQVGAKQAHRMHGSGVGLALTRALVEEMGGRLEVESVRGQGSVFRVCLPRANEVP